MDRRNRINTNLIDEWKETEKALELVINNLMVHGIT